MQQKDQLFAEISKVSAFAFDEQVVSVFPDMIKRSVPGYETILKGIAMYAMRNLQSGSRVYDLGASLGAVSLTIDRAIGAKQLKIHAVDNAPAMLDGLHSLITRQTINNSLIIEATDLNQLQMQPTDMVISNFTLQFIDPQSRTPIIDNIYQNLNQQGIFILSEKIDSSTALIDDYHGYKKINGYSNQEIARKRQALEDILQPDSQQTWQQRLKQAGFKRVEIWFKAFNFVSFICQK